MKRYKVNMLRVDKYGGEKWVYRNSFDNKDEAIKRAAELYPPACVTDTETGNIVFEK